LQPITSSSFRYVVWLLFIFLIVFNVLHQNVRSELNGSRFSCEGGASIVILCISHKFKHHLGH
jgi:hypothetical protein